MPSSATVQVGADNHDQRQGDERGDRHGQLDDVSCQAEQARGSVSRPPVAPVGGPPRASSWSPTAATRLALSGPETALRMPMTKPAPIITAGSARRHGRHRYDERCQPLSDEESRQRIGRTTSVAGAGPSTTAP